VRRRPGRRDVAAHADLLGDPVARIRHSPHYRMLVRACVYVYLRCARMAVQRSALTSEPP